MKFGRILASTVVAFLAVIGLAVVNAPAAHAVNPLNPWRFQYSSICVNNWLPYSNYPVNYSRDRWNQAPDLAIYYGWMTPAWPYANGCATHYEQAQMIDVHYYEDASTTCVHIDVYRDPTYGFVTDANIWLNIKPACSSDAGVRAHFISQAIGYALGLDTHENGTRSVMSTTPWSVANVWYPETADFQAIEARYPW